MWTMRAATCVWILIAASACNVDSMFEPSQSKSGGETTPIEHPAGVDLPDIMIVDMGEVDLVEQVLMHRAQYSRSLGALHDYYVEHGYANKRIWAEHEMADVRRIKPFRYILSSEIPSEDLRPTESIAEADALLGRGESLMKAGGHDLPIVYRENKLREALRVFRELIETYPSSDKIDDAAFFCGEIHKEYFRGEEQLAVRWYERAFTWDPQTPHPARFQAAAVCDLRLQDRERALELYHQVIDHESSNKSNVSFAMRRIEQLSRDAESDNSPAMATP